MLVRFIIPRNHAFVFSSVARKSPPNQCLLGFVNLGWSPFHTYRDTFESANFSLRVQKKSCPHVSYSSRISPILILRCLCQKKKTCALPTNVIMRHSLVPYFTQKSLDPISLHQRFRKFRDSNVHTTPYSKRILKNPLGERIRKVADSSQNS